jgi:hypothetical protein
MRDQISLLGLVGSAYNATRVFPWNQQRSDGDDDFFEWAGR